MMLENPILITGSHRSGSTWLGRMLALAEDVTYIDEPFRLNTRKGIFASPIDKWFYYINQHNAEQHRGNLRKTLSFEYNLKAELAELRTIKDVARMFRDIYRCQKSKSTRPLMKDPIAFFSVPYIANEFDASVVVVIRHPCAFVASLCNANWEFDFNHFLDQPELMQDYLTEFSSQIELFAADPKPLFDQAILLWSIFHRTIIRYQQEAPHWNFVRHEDLALAPVVEFSKIYELLNLEFSSEIQKAIQLSTAAGNPIENNDRQHEVRRDSRKLVKKWKGHLNEKEVMQIRNQCSEIADQFYGPTDW